jgi:hypothetical protein
MAHDESKYDNCDGGDDEKKLIPLTPSYSRELIMADGWRIQIRKNIDMEGNPIVTVSLGHPRLPQHAEQNFELHKIVSGIDIALLPMMNVAMDLSNEQL